MHTRRSSLLSLSLSLFTSEYAHVFSFGSMVGFYHAKMFERVPEAQKMEHSREAASAYLDAADIFPEDDEYHTCTHSHYFPPSSKFQIPPISHSFHTHIVGYLNAAVGHMARMGVPVKALLDVMKRIRESIPKMKKVWEFSALAQSGRDLTLNATLQQETVMRNGLLDGRYTLDEIYRV